LVRCYLGLGSNLGDKTGAVREGARRLSARGDIRLARLSSLYLSRPWGYGHQPDFVNAVAEVETGLEPGELLKRAKGVEEGMGRKRRFRWGPREVDIDLLLYGDAVLEGDGFVVPHPRMEERDFVLVPLLELAPGLVNPATGIGFAASLEKLAALGEVSCSRLVA
jgi:2-amino-4-hydroxy-6-hydroxymethyldihydropteridine diphosphokinase